MRTAHVTIPEASQGKPDLVAIPRQDYEEFLEIKAETTDALEKIKQGNKEVKQGKIKPISSVRELM